MLNIFFLILAFLITFFMVGFSVIELFLPKIIFRIKVPLYFITSLVVSAYLIYTVSLFFGLSRNIIFGTLSPFILVSVFFIYKLRSDFLIYIKSNLVAILLVGFIVLIYFCALSPAILGHKDNYLVMSGVNWQDTALHLSITQSLTQGNFPPQAPYFSGAPLSYYYFTDLHSSILATAFGQFFPRVFVYDNALLAGVLALTLYSLAFHISKNKKLACASACIGSFYGSFIFINFFKEIFGGRGVIEVLSNTTYSMEYQQIFGMANMADYYLQNRPMMLGLPVVVMSILLLIYAFRKEKLSVILLAGLLSAALVKIQFFCVLAGVLGFIVFSLSPLRKSKFKFVCMSYLCFLIPILISYLVFGTRSVNGVHFFSLIIDTFRFGPWNNERSLVWYGGFALLNLGIPFIVSLAALISRVKKSTKLISGLALLFTIIPFIVTFTIDGSDMFKFFYFAALLFSMITPLVLYKIIKNKAAFNSIVVLVVFVTTFSSVLTLANSYLNKNSGYSVDDYIVGEWIRSNTPEKSVFVTTTSVHSAPTDFGGRLRVISYTNWPYTHGFNGGQDNVFVRAEDVAHVYDTGDVGLVKLKYKANYVFYGEEESNEFPDTGELFDLNKDLELVYDRGKIKIFKII